MNMIKLKAIRAMFEHENRAYIHNAIDMACYTQVQLIHYCLAIE